MPRSSASADADEPLVFSDVADESVEDEGSQPGGDQETLLARDTKDEPSSEGCCSMARDYMTLLRRNHAFRNMLLSMVVSGLGSWINEVATVVVLQRLSSSTFAVAGFFTMRMMSIAVMGPIAGVFIDRYDKSSILLVCDAVRIVIVLGYLLVQTPSMIWLVYVVIFAHSIFGAVSRPCSQAIVPELVGPKLVASANALNSLAETVPLAVGSALGGVVTAFAGSNVAYILDSCSFAVSVFFVWRLRCSRHEAMVEAEREKAEEALAKKEDNKEGGDALLEMGKLGDDGEREAGEDAAAESNDKLDEEKAAEADETSAAATPPKVGKCAEIMGGIVYLLKYERGVFGVMVLGGLNRFSDSAGDLVMTKLSAGPFRMGFADASFSFGMAYAVAAVGILLMSFVKGAMMNHPSQRKLFSWLGGASVMLIFAYTGASIAPWAWMYLVSVGFVGAGLVVMWVQVANILTHKAPPHLRGRFFSLLLSLRYLFGAAGFLLTSVMLDVFGWSIPLTQFVGATLPSIVVLLACIAYRIRAKT